MDNFTFCSVQKIAFGIDSILSLPAEVERLGCKKPVIVTDKTVEKSVVSKLDLGYDVCSEVEQEPKLDIVDVVAETIERGKYDVVVGIGGGSVLDTAKLSSIIAFSEKKAAEFIDSDLPARRIKLILCPTTAGTGAEVTKLAVFRVEGMDVKYVFDSDALYADVAIVDPKLTLSAPQSVSVDAGLDALCHAIEAYTSVLASPITDMLAERAIEIASRSLREVYANGSNLKARERMSYAALLAGIAFNNAGTSLAHALGYAHSHIHGYSHGRSVAITMPYVLQYNAIASLEKHARIAELMGEKTDAVSLRDAAKLAGIAFARLLEDLGVPTRLLDVGASEDDIDDIVDRIFQSRKHVSRNPRIVKREDMIVLVRKAMYGELETPQTRQKNR